MYQLICEGRCNPTIGYADDLVERFKDEDRRVDPNPLVLDRHRAAMFAAQHRLVHTPHEVFQETQATCQVCGHQRVYGGARRYQYSGWNAA